jgi:hypothetical protein
MGEARLSEERKLAMVALRRFPVEARRVTLGRTGLAERTILSQGD